MNNSLCYKSDSCFWKLRPGCKGLAVHRKLSYPARFGVYHELITPECTYHLSLDGFPKFFQGNRRNWPHPQEWLKITRNGDMVYYSTQGYSDIFGLTGEYYYPLLSYHSNSLFSSNIFQSIPVSQVIADHDNHCTQAGHMASSWVNRKEAAILWQFSQWTTSKIRRQARRLHRIIQARIPVLPPDCRHVDYDVLPLIVAEGCLANCGFCQVKTSGDFRLRSKKEIENQLSGIGRLLGDDIGNYRGFFLGQHDCLAAGSRPIKAALKKVISILTPGRKYVRNPVAFLFGSTHSLLALTDDDLKRLEQQPCTLYINIGLESFDQETLDILQKPVSAKENRLAFQKALAINRKYSRIRVSANLVLGELTGSNHLNRILKILCDDVPSFQPETTIYLSPLTGFFQSKNVLSDLRRIKSQARLPVYPYLIHQL